MDLTYVTSSLEPSSWPRLLDAKGAPLPEIALAGRSNVGKSTFLNLLAGSKTSAKVSSVPGKTQRIQFFQVANRLCLVDLPGYGFAKAPLDLQAEWSQAIDAYLRERSPLKLLVLLLDIRRNLSPDDVKLLYWAKNRSLEVLPILTKADKLSKTDCEDRKKFLSKCLGLPIPLVVPAPGKIVWNTLTEKIYATH